MTSTSKRRIIVVLGMHRSGTSVLTRALVALGAQVSDNLLPASDDNPKGFWEDRDFVLFNEQLLKVLGSGFDDLQPLDEHFTSHPDVQALRLQAVTLLREKLEQTSVFALKDPRTCRLLPFWQEVFRHLQVDVDYVIAVRHPLCVVDSLARRNGFLAEKSLHLWFQHYLSALSVLSVAPAAFVDYDRLLEAPREQLLCLAEALHLSSVDEASLSSFIEHFLAQDLRHARYLPDDLSLLDELPDGLQEAYQELLEASRQGVADWPAHQQFWQRLARQQSLQRGWLRQLGRFDTALELQRQQARSASEQVQQIQEHLQHCQHEHTCLLARHEQLAAQLLHEQGRLTLEQSHTNELRGELHHEQQRVQALQVQLEGLRDELTRVETSHSMRLTAPLRDLRRSLSRLAGRIALRRARLRQLLQRSRQVLRDEGVVRWLLRSLGFVQRALLRQVRLRRAERYLPLARSVGQTPLVSFIIPIYDRTDVLREAIQSALAQTISDLEVLLITDGSPAPTLHVVESFRDDPRVRIFHYPVSSGNAVRGRNKGILEARGRYIAFLDSDDIALPERLAHSLPLLERGEADVVYGAWQACLDGSRAVDGLVDGQVVHSPDCDLELLLQVCVPCQSTVMVRRELLLRSGFLKPRMKYREDHELWARLAHAGGRFKAVDQVLTRLRLHAGNNELNFKDNDAHWAQLLQEEYALPGPLPMKIVYLLSSVGISGGAAVALRHVSLLQEAGHDVCVLNVGNPGSLDWFGNPALRVYTLDTLDALGVENIDCLVASFWTTCEWLERLPAKRKLYLVQSDERLFYDDAQVKAQVADTYGRDYEYLVIARWLGDMLHDEFARQRVHYVPNGLDTERFHPCEPLQAKPVGRLRVLLEGPISVPFKGVADAYAAVAGLDCELWIVSSSGRPPSSWRYTRFFEGVSQAEMPALYASCDILVKLSRVESFAYPPLEAMACGCNVVLGQVSGGVEYAIDEVNLLLVAQADVLAARQAVERLMADPALRERLREAGLATARQWTWQATREALLAQIGPAQACLLSGE